MGAATSETGTSTSAKRAGNVATETGTEARRAVDKAESWLESKKKVRYTMMIHFNTKNVLIEGTKAPRRGECSIRNNSAGFQLLLIITIAELLTNEIALCILITDGS